MGRIYLFMLLAAYAAMVRDDRGAEDSRRLASMMAHPSMEGRLS